MLRANGAAVAARSRLTRPLYAASCSLERCSSSVLSTNTNAGTEGFGPDLYYSIATWGGGGAPGNSC
jgi:hypothetical protein